MPDTKYDPFLLGCMMCISKHLLDITGQIINKMTGRGHFSASSMTASILLPSIMHLVLDLIAHVHIAGLGRRTHLLSRFPPA